MGRAPQRARLFEDPPPTIAGFLYEPELLTVTEEAALLDDIRQLTFRDVLFRGVLAKRRTVQLGYHYSFQSRSLTPSAPIPEWLLPVRERAAALAGVAPDDFAEALVTEYQPGAGIGWHKDAPPFGVIAGVSLAGSCELRLRKGTDTSTTVKLELAPRSAYVFAGEVRSAWQHSIPPTKVLRYSVTFRTLRRHAAGTPTTLE
jgi:alkylated DNA repair protein (DNA oxidative demethylase)